MKHYLNNLGILSAVTVVIMAVSFFGIIQSIPSQADEIEVTEEIDTVPITEETQQQEEVAETEVVEEDVLEPINGLLIGFDKTGGLTDVIMVGHIDPANNKVSIISIPRDLEIYFTDDEFNHIKKNNPNNQVLHCKLNNIYSLIGWDERALQDVREVVEVITGLEMDYMMTIDTSGFGEMVDMVGGVEFYVPQRMYYNDPYQDLHIDLYEGLQVLDGDKAEQLVRYRKDYERGDLQRIEIQQQFMSAFVDKAVGSRDFGQITQLIQKGFELVDTDFGAIVVMEYAEFFFELELEHILSSDNMMTIPSYGEKVDGVWFQFFELEEARKAVKDLIEDVDEPIGTTENE